MEGKALGGTGAYAGKFAQGGDEAESSGRVIGHPESSGSALVDNPGVELLQRGLNGRIVEKGFLAGGDGGCRGSSWAFGEGGFGRGRGWDGSGFGGWSG